MATRLVAFLNKNDIIFKHQFGFQKGKSTSLAILDIYNKIISCFEDKRIACCIFMFVAV